MCTLAITAEQIAFRLLLYLRTNVRYAFVEQAGYPRCKVDCDGSILACTTFALRVGALVVS